jgi:potassium-transporting ATPase KdpC subunit
MKMKATVTALRMLLVMTVLTGLVYPSCVTLISRALFPDKTGGSILMVDGKEIGSRLVAQKFTSRRYFWPRPSAFDYATLPSGASNRGLTSMDLKKSYEERKTCWITAHGEGAGSADMPLPPDMLFASGSGIDPHISPEAARIQIRRVAAARGFSHGQIINLCKLVEKHVEKPILGFMGESRINVLLLNIALDRM